MAAQTALGSSSPPTGLDCPDCRSTSSPNPTTLDHRAYPHLIERIVSFADARTLLVFSRTAHAYRPLAARAVHHLVAYRRGRSLALRSSRGPLGRDVPEATHQHVVAAQRVAGAALLAQTAVLDMLGATGKHQPASLAFLAPETLRVREAAGRVSAHSFWGFRPRCVVVFGDLALHVLGDVAAYWSGPGVPADTRLVWNVRGMDGGDGRTAKVRITEKRLQEVVLHFGAFAGELPRERFVEWLAVLLRVEEELRVRLVGMEGVSLEAMGFAEPPGSLEDAQSALLDGIGGAAARVEFVCAQEYAARVGRRQYELETVEELW